MNNIKLQMNYVNSSIRKNTKLRRLKVFETFKNILNFNNMESFNSILVYEDIVFEAFKRKTNSILEPKLNNILNKLSNYYNHYDWIVNISFSYAYKSSSFVFITVESNEYVKTTFVLLSEYVENLENYINLLEKLDPDDMSLELSIPKDLFNSDYFSQPQNKINLPPVVCDIFNFLNDLEEKQLSPLQKKEKVNFTIHLVFKNTLEWYVTYFDNNYALFCYKFAPNRPFLRRKKATYQSTRYSIENNNKLTYLRSIHDSGFIKIPDDILENADEDLVFQSLEYIKILGY